MIASHCLCIHDFDDAVGQIAVMLPPVLQLFSGIMIDSQVHRVIMHSPVKQDFHLMIMMMMMMMMMVMMMIAMLFIVSATTMNRLSHCQVQAIDPHTHTHTYTHTYIHLRA